MRKLRTLLSAVVCVVFGASCVSRGSHDSHFDFQVYNEDSTLVGVEFQQEDGPNRIRRAVDRDRLAVRFAFGGAVSRGFFQIFKEDDTVLINPFTPASPVEYEVFGMGGGAMGAPVIGDEDADLKFIVPWRADMSLAIGEDSASNGSEIGYLEIHLELGLGLEWQGLRPSVGFALSSLAGIASFEGASDQEIASEADGLYVDLQYKHPSVPVYLQARAQSGDYEVATFGFGFRF